MLNKSSTRSLIKKYTNRKRLGSDLVEDLDEYIEKMIIKLLQYDNHQQTPESLETLRFEQLQESLFLLQQNNEFTKVSGADEAEMNPDKIDIENDQFDININLNVEKK